MHGPNDMRPKDFLADVPGLSRIEVVEDTSVMTDADRQVLSQLQAAGADLSKQTHARFYVYAPSEEAAKRIAEATVDSVLKAEVRPAALGGGWLCLLQGEIIPSPDVLRAYRSKFEVLALAAGGEYDGWEAAVVE